jgi:NTP pyrophosphatase (non-canonical NTP hydrolase)
MDFREYQEQASFSHKPAKPLTTKQASILDWTLGICDEAGEVAGVIKHHIFHNEPLDIMKVAKELGDVQWYISALCEELGIDLGVCAELNIAKLRHRHGSKYSDETSADRHSNEERFENTTEYQQIKERIAYGAR